MDFSEVATAVRVALGATGVVITIGLGVLQAGQAEKQSTILMNFLIDWRALQDHHLKRLQEAADGILAKVQR